MNFVYIATLSYNKGIITAPDSNYVPNPKGVGHEFFRNMILHKKKIMQIDAVTGEEETFEVVLQKCVRTAIHMRQHGVCRGDVISTCTPNHLNSFVPIISALFLGAIVSSLEPLDSEIESVHLMEIIDPKLIFVSEDTVNYTESILKPTGKKSKLIVFGNTKQHLSFSDFLQPSKEESNFEPVEMNLAEIAFIFFSSGSTDYPKGICISHRGYLERIGVAANFHNCYDRILDFCSLYWGRASILRGISILTGTLMIIPKEFERYDAWSLIDKYQPTFMFSSPFYFLDLCKAGVEGKDYTRLKTIEIAGGILFEHQLLNCQKLFPSTILAIAYGLTETGIVTYFDWRTEKQNKFMETKTGTIGTVVNGTSYKVVDLDTEEVLGPRKPGELRLKTNAQMIGYYKNDSFDAWDSEGWFRTGDMVYYDEDYYFYFVDRIKKLMKHKDMHVVPKYIEEVLLTHPNVHAVCVTGKLHEVDGEHPIAFVQLKNVNIKHNIEEELLELVQKRLDDKYQLRGGVEIVLNFPLTPTGKVDVRTLKRIYNL